MNSLVVSQSTKALNNKASGQAINLLDQQYQAYNQLAHR